MKKNYIYVIFATALMAACSSDDIAPDTTTDQVELRLTSGIEVETRATQSTQIANGETVYAWVDDATDSTALYSSQQLTADGNGNLSGQTKMFFPQKGRNINIYAIHGNITSPTKTGGTFSVAADQSNDGTAYTNSDLLLACQKNVARNGNPTTQSLTFYHLLSKLELQIFVGTGAPQLASSAAVTLDSVATSGTLSADYSKDIAKQSDRAAMVIADTTTTATMTLAQTLSDSTTTVSNEAILVPQSMAGKTLSFALKNGGTLSYTFPDKTTFESGKKYIYKITLTLTELKVSSTIEDWTATDDTIGNATMKQQ